MSSSLTLDFADAAARRNVARSSRGLNVVQLHDELWRITLPEGEVLGYIERFAARHGARYRAKRFLPRQRRFLVDGEVWAMDDAIECFASL